MWRPPIVACSAAGESLNGPASFGPPNGSCGFPVWPSSRWAYLANPKLWAKLAVVTVWLGSTLVMRHVAVPRLRLGLRTPMLWTCSVSGACWLYGAFLGVAKPLAGGVVPLAVFLAGFAAVIMGCLAATAYFEAIKRRALRSQADGSLRQSKQTADASR
jgi:hypothetical protein